ncbi:MAG: carbohydrate-binding domain-containing protein [Clostridia bacterium]|nr:carbohydrate-binding domain-containing protein [Clostridia bacterium]
MKTTRFFGKLKAFAIVLTAIALIFAVCACSSDPAGEKPADPTAAPVENPTATPGETANEDPSTIPQVVSTSDQFTKFDTTIAYVPEECTKIILKQDASEVTGQGAVVEGNTVTINTAGSYILSGTLTDGQIVVNVEKTEKVRLILNGVSVTNTKSACIYVMSADKVGITMATGTENTFTDAKTYTELDAKGNPNACIYSKDDLTINGYGSLTVNANYNNGIGCKNDLSIVTGTVTVKAPNNALKAKESFRMHDGIVNVTSEDDAVKVDGDDDISKGYIFMEGGTLNLTAADDALTATFKITITGGVVTTKVDGKSLNCLGEVSIAKGSLVEK